MTIAASVTSAVSSAISVASAGLKIMATGVVGIISAPVLAGAWAARRLAGGLGAGRKLKNAMTVVGGVLVDSL